MSVWSLEYEGFDVAGEGLRESLCTLGNGYFATRGAAPERDADDVHYPGTYVAGCYDRLSTELAGRTVENEDLVNVPNWLPLTFRIAGGDWFDARVVNVLEYHQALDLRAGVLTRTMRFRDPQGRTSQLTQRRFVHMEDAHLAALETTLLAEDWSGEVQIRSALDGRVVNAGVPRYRRLNGRHLRPIGTRILGDNTILLQVMTVQSRIEISQASRTRLFRDTERLAAEPETIEEPGYVAQTFSIDLERGGSITVEKVVSLFTSRDRAISDSGLAARIAVTRAAGFQELLRGHALAWEHLWRRCALTIEGPERVSMILNLHVFHLLQTVSMNTIDLDVGVPARGLHGEAYRGHVFWDELFVLPFLNLHLPELARSLLGYRYRRLPEARWAAREAGYEGAMYPWQSGSSGREETPVVHLNPESGRWLSDNSHIQRHINVAIAYNVWRYYEATGDRGFLSLYGAEMMLEIARSLVSLTEYDRARDRYQIRGVMGPDEYHDGYPGAGRPGIDNNAYTNVMTAWVLCRALEIPHLLPERRRAELWERLALRWEELQRWEEISRKMQVCFHDDGIISQFEGYERLRELDWDGYRQRYGDIRRLDRILDAEGDSPNRYKLSKQADVLMLLYLLPAKELRSIFERLRYPFGEDTIPKNTDYYSRRTSHGSTLSKVVHSWVLARSDRERSWQLLTEALESDISDAQGGTTREGIHLGAMAGVVDLVQRCYVGIETHDDTLWLDPELPDELAGLEFDLHYRGRWIDLRVIDGQVRMRPEEGGTGPIFRVGVGDEGFTIEPGSTEEIRAAPMIADP